MQLTRRGFLMAVSAMPFIPTHEWHRQQVKNRAQTGSFEKVDNRDRNKRRIGNFEESGIEVITWVEKNQFKPEILLQFEQFKAGLNFELDSDIEALVSSTVGKSDRRGFVKKNGHIFEFDVNAKDENPLFTFFGKIASETKIGKTDVYIMDFLIGEEEAAAGRQISETNRVYISLDKAIVRINRKEDEYLEAFVGFGVIFKENKDGITELFSKQPFDLGEFDLFCLELAETYHVNAVILRNSLIFLKLIRNYIKEYNGLETQQSKQRALRNIVFSTLIHEVVHGETDNFTKDRGISLTPSEKELLGNLAELGYGMDKYYRLAQFIKIQITEGNPESYVLVAQAIMSGFERYKYTPSRTLTITSKEIGLVARKLLDDFCKYKFGLLFDKVVNVSLFEEARRFVESIDIGKD